MEAGIILRKAQKYSIERWNYHSPTTIIDYTAGFKAALEMMEKKEVENLVKPDVSGQFCKCNDDFNIPTEVDGKIYCYKCDREIDKLQNFR